MRDFSADHRWLSLNTATVRKQGDLTAIIEACARHGIRAIDPWRDQVASVGLDRKRHIGLLRVFQHFGDGVVNLRARRRDIFRSNTARARILRQAADD